MAAPDTSTVTFDLWPDATFHDGRPATAADVKWSLEHAIAAGGFPAIKTGASRMTDPHACATQVKTFILIATDDVPRIALVQDFRDVAMQPAIEGCTCWFHATAVARRMAKGTAPAPLAGVPVAVKDLILTGDMPTAFGPRLCEGLCDGRDDIVVGRLRRAGVFLIGKTNCPEFGYGGFGHNPLFATTRNPWNPGLTALRAGRRVPDGLAALLDCPSLRCAPGLARMVAVSRMAGSCRALTLCAVRPLPACRLPLTATALERSTVAQSQTMPGRQPAASVPAGKGASGLPVGLQIAGGHLADNRVVSACAASTRRVPGLPFGA